MRKAVKQILLCAAALLLVCLACRAAFFDHLNIYIPLQGATEPEAEIRVEQPDAFGEIEIESLEDAGETSLAGDEYRMEEEIGGEDVY